MTETKKNFLILAIAIIISIMTVEFILRFFEKQSYVAIWMVNEDGLGIYRPNMDKYLFDNEDYKRYHVKTNSLGFLGEDVSEEKAAGTLRVVALGDSFTAATGVDYNKNFPYLLEKKLQDLIFANPSSTYNKVEVLNFGLGGTGTVEAMKYYEKYAQKYHPDLVVLNFYLQNDIEDNSFNYAYKEAALSSKEKWNAFPQYYATQVKNFVAFKDRVYRKSAIIRFVDRVVRSSPRLNSLAIKAGLYRPPARGESGLVLPLYAYYYLDPLDAEREQHLKFSYDLLNNFKKQLDADGVKFAVMFIPDGVTVSEKMMNDFKEKYPKLKDFNYNPIGMENKLFAGIDPSIKMINLRETMEKQVSENKEMYKNGWGHFAEDGHAVASDVLSNFIYDSFLK